MALISLDASEPGRLLQVNQWMAELTGHSEQDLLQRCWVDLVHPDDRAEQALLFDSVVSGGISHSDAEVRWADGGGPVRWVRMRLHALREVVTGPAYAVGQVEDITDRRRIKAAVAAREERFRVAFDDAVIGMTFLGLSGVVRAANGALATFLGRPNSELVGQHLETLVWRDEQTDLRVAIDELAAGTTGAYQAEHRFVRGDGPEVWGMVSGMLVDDEDGHPAYLVFQVRDVTWRKDAEMRLSHQALHDGLTGLANRVLLNDRLDQARGRAERNRTYIAVLFIDLDGFKGINDRFGHAAGDQVLIEFAQRLHASLRETDTACRWGGDEFVVVCDDLADPDDVTVISDRVAATLDAPFTVAGTDIAVTASVGITTNDGTAASDDLLCAADTAMFHAKGNGKSRREIYNPQTPTAMPRTAPSADQ